MCGIAGIMTLNGEPPDSSLLARLAKALRHRGPDGMGTHVARNVGMVQTRLAIIDLQTGDQPLYEPGGAALVANGEIYNYLELRASLTDVEFATGSDCEPPLYLYRRYGLNFVDHLRGMYAIALHDPVEGQLVLSRDPFGIKPLYYLEATDGLAFASEPQALLAAGLAAPSLNEVACGELLQLQYTTGADTVFAGVQRLLPGETLIVRDGRVVARRRRSALGTEPPLALSEAEAMRRLDRALLDSVEVHQRADVPYGMFLSGGIDSSVLLTLMAQLNDRPVRAYTAGFGDAPVPDERAHARAVARALGADMVEVSFDQADFWRLLPRIAAVMDDPAADYAILPTFKLSAAVRADGLKVILSGEGGDELFAGYGRYRSAMRPWWRGGRSMRTRGIFDRLDVLRERPAGWRDGLTAAEATAEFPGRSRLQMAQSVDCADWLPNDLLIKLDRCLMAHSVEGRTPFLDPEVTAVGYRLPDALKVRDGLGKWLLRKWLDDHLPIANAFERKRGFSVPVGAWIHQHGERIGPLVAHQPGVAAMCEPAAVEKLFVKRGRRAGFASWILLFFALWHNHHIVGNRASGGDAFDVLGDARAAA
jgi:asparagine synthase (glutamine-hydrolysing)